MPTGKKITDPSIPQTGSGLSDFAGLLTLGVNSQNQSVRIPLGDILHRTIVRAGVIYRIDTEHPLTSGYYTLTTAIQTIAADVNVSADERSGMVLIFYDGTVFRIYQFEKKYDNSGGVEPSVKFLNTDNWKELDLYAKADKADVYTKEEVDEMNDGMEENIVALMEKKADKTGLHHSLGSGTSDGLAGTDVVDAEYTLRCTGDKMSNLGTGAAAIDTVKGNTLVWNQLIKTDQWSTSSVPSGITATNNGDGSFTLNGTASVSGYIRQSVGSGLVGKKVYVSLGIANEYLGISEGTSGEGFGDKSRVITFGNSTYIYVYINSGASFSNVKIYPTLHDLTKMFGSGYEPSTVAEFEARYPLNYYDYNSGTLINNAASGIKTIGFNQWDGTYYAGLINSNGTINTSSSVKHSDYIRVFPLTKYYINYGLASQYAAFSYDINYNFLGKHGGNSPNGIEFTTHENAAYVRINIMPDKVDKTCLNLSWSGYRNGEYEPYEEHTVYFDSALGASGSLATIKGRKLNAQGEIDDPTAPSAAVFTDGMKSAVNAYDEAKETTAKKVLSENIVLSNIAWVVDSNGLAYSPRITNLKGGVVNSKANFITTAPYTSVVTPQYHSAMGNNEISISTDNRIFIHDTSCTTIEQLNTKLANAVLCAELATPETYLLDNPLPRCYAENKLGTEERLPKDTASAVNAPLKYTVKYPMNIAKNYVSADSISNLLSELATKFGAAMSKTITITPTFNENTQEFDYSINIT